MVPELQNISISNIASERVRSKWASSFSASKCLRRYEIQEDEKVQQPSPSIRGAKIVGANQNCVWSSKKQMKTKMQGRTLLTYPKFRYLLYVLRPLVRSCHPNI